MGVVYRGSASSSLSSGTGEWIWGGRGEEAHLSPKLFYRDLTHFGIPLVTNLPPPTPILGCHVTTPYH